MTTSWRDIVAHAIRSALEIVERTRITVGPNVTGLDGSSSYKTEAEPDARNLWANWRQLNQTAGLILDAMQVPTSPVRLLGYGGDRSYQSVLVAALLRPGQSIEAALLLPALDGPEPGLGSLLLNWQLEGPRDAVARFPEDLPGDSRSLTGLCTIGQVTLEPGKPRRVIISRLGLGKAPIQFEIQR